MLVLWLSFLIAVADQYTKEFVRQRFFPGEVLPVIPGFFNLTYVRNTGAAWGIFDGGNSWLAILSLAVLVVLLVFRRHLAGTGRLQSVALGFMAGGIVGNLLDRLRLDFVVDFLDFHYRAYHFPSFNVADAAICVGVGLYLIATYRTGSGHAAAAPGGGVAGAGS